MLIYVHRFSPCTPFVNGTRVLLQQEVITVTCKVKDNSVQNNLIYEDAYIILKELHIKKNNMFKNYWNVLILGMDTMSRARAFQSMPKLVQYFKLNSWLDYRGFQKVDKVINKLCVALLIINKNYTSANKHKIKS